MSEYWDLYDEKRMPLGRTHKRGHPMEEGTYHQVVAIWAVDADGKLLITLRDQSKELYPGLWESTSGSAKSGESSVEAAQRELVEETGLYVPLEEITFLGSAQKAASFVDIFIVFLDEREPKVTLQQGETTAYRWLRLTELDQLIADGLFAFPLTYHFSYFRPLIEARWPQ